jgi:hypothetical protein
MKRRDFIAGLGSAAATAECDERGEHHRVVGRAPEQWRVVHVGEHVTIACGETFHGQIGEEILLSGLFLRSEDFKLLLEIGHLRGHGDAHPTCAAGGLPGAALLPCVEQRFRPLHQAGPKDQNAARRQPKLRRFIPGDALESPICACERVECDRISDGWAHLLLW